MPTPDQQTNVSNAISAIQAAEGLLYQQVSNAPDSLTAIKITNEIKILESYLSQLQQAVTAADDASFTSITDVLQSHTNQIKNDQATIQKIVADVNTAANIINYIGQAAAFIAKL
jgi:hypothetical protein